MMALVPVTVVSLTPFLRKAREIGLSEAEIEAIELAVAEAPDEGDLIQGSGGVRKRRVAIPGRAKGKSGGGRVFTIYFHLEAPVYILAMLDKSEAGNLTKAELKQLAALAAALKAATRKDAP
jgi:hypothetical protein